MKKILNTIHEDYHMHSINYSDGMNTIDEIVQYAGKIWLKKIVITDHSQIVLDKANIWLKSPRSIIQNRRKNVHNDIDVSFGVEWDLINEKGDCCFDIKWLESDFNILSCHESIFEWDLKNVTQAYTNAITKHHDKIKFIWHICQWHTSKDLDIKAITRLLNKYNIPIELNCYYLNRGYTNLDKLNQLLALLETWVYVNSDMHTLNDFSFRQAWFDYLKLQWYSN